MDALTMEELQKLMELSGTVGEQEALAEQLRKQSGMLSEMGATPQMRQAGGVTVGGTPMEYLGAGLSRLGSIYKENQAGEAAGKARGAQDQQNQQLMAALLRQNAATQAAAPPAQAMPKQPTPSPFQAPTQGPAALGSGMFGIR